MSVAEKTDATARKMGGLGTGEVRLVDFWELAPQQIESILLDAIVASHAWHYERNWAYRHAVSARGVGPEIGPDELPRLSCGAGSQP